MREIKIPEYTRGEEWFNSITHIVGAVMSLVALLLCFWQAMRHGGSVLGIISALIYGFSSVILYTCSSIYHGLYVNNGKKVMRVIDHSSIYILICGTYTPYLLMTIYPTNKALAISILACIWGVSAICIALTAIDLEKFKALLMASYLILGWSIVFTMKKIHLGMHSDFGYYLIIAAGLFYTVGSIIYGMGKKKKWFHSIFHLFVLVASILFFISIFGYVLTIKI